MLLKDGDKTLMIPDALLRRRWGLPDEAGEAEIKAAIITRSPLPVRTAAVRAAAVRAAAVRPLLDAAARVKAASNDELRQLAGRPLPSADDPPSRGIQRP